MKKLILAALAMGIAIGSVSFVAAQDTSSSTTKKTRKHKKSKKSSDTSKM